MAAASVRERQRSFARMLRTCMSTVRVLSTSSPAISRFVPPGGDQAHHLELAAGQAGVLVVGGRAPAEPPLDRLAEPRDLGGRLRGERRGAEAARRAMRLDQPLDRGVALPGGGERDARAELDLRALERDLEARVELGRAADLLGGGVRVALGERRLAERVRERRERVRVARPGRDARQRLGARRAPRRAGRGARRSTTPSAGPRPRSGGPRCATSAPAGSGSGSRAWSRSPSCSSSHGERGGAVDAHRDHVEARRRVEAPDEQRPGRRAVAAEGVDRSERCRPRPACRPGCASRAAQLVRELRRAIPVAELAQDVGHAAEARVLEAVGPVRLAEADRGVERVARAAVVAGDLVRGAEPLVDLRRLERELVLEREREPGPDRLHPLVELPALDARDALRARGPAPAGRSRSARAASSPARRVELDRVAVVAGALQVAGGDQPLRRGLAGEAVGGEGVGRDAAARPARARGRPAAS